jgi:hypothetical protein
MAKSREKRKKQSLLHQPVKSTHAKAEQTRRQQQQSSKVRMAESREKRNKQSLLHLPVRSNVTIPTAAAHHIGVAKIGNINASKQVRISQSRSGLDRWISQSRSGHKVTRYAVHPKMKDAKRYKKHSNTHPSHLANTERQKKSPKSLVEILREAKAKLNKQEDRLEEEEKREEMLLHQGVYTKSMLAFFRKERAKEAKGEYPDMPQKKGAHN